MAHQILTANTSYTFPHPTDNQIIFGVEGGSLAVTPWQSDQVQVFCRIDPEDAGKFEFSADTNGTLSVQGHRKLGSIGFLKVLMTAQVPADCTLDLHATGGSIDVGHHGAAITAQIGGGNIHIGSAANSLAISASGGSVSVDAVSGQVRVNASGGSIRIAGLQGKADVETSGGSIDLSFLPPPDARVRSSGGSIRLRVGATAAFQLVAAADGGTLTILPPLVASGVVSSHYSGPINGGGATTVDASASGGSIVVAQA